MNATTHEELTTVGRLAFEVLPLVSEDNAEPLLALMPDEEYLRAAFVVA